MKRRTFLGALLTAPIVKTKPVTAYYGGRVEFSPYPMALKMASNSVYGKMGYLPKGNK